MLALSCRFWISDRIGITGIELAEKEPVYSNMLILHATIDIQCY